MSTTEQPEALWLADELDADFAQWRISNGTRRKAATELRRQHARIAELEAQLESIGAGGVSGPLVGCASIAASAGSEPVAWRVRRHDAPNYWIIFLHRPVDAMADPGREVQPLYTHPSPPEGMVGGWIASKDQMPPPGVRVFWGDVDSNRVGYDSWAGDDYRWAPSHWMHIPEFPAPPTTSAGSGKGGES